MGRVLVDISMSLDGCIAGPNTSREQPLGEGGERLHEWGFGLKSWREAHGLAGGTTGPDDEVSKEMFATSGAVVMGRRMFGGGDGPWGDEAWGDQPWEGRWGDDPPFHMPVFVLTHHARAPATKQGGTTFHVRHRRDRERAGAGIKLEPTRVVDSPAVTHLTYRVAR